MPTDRTCWPSTNVDTHTSHEIYSGLLAIEVSPLGSFDGSTLARALRSPRPLLADNLRAKGALSVNDHRALIELWEAMRAIEPEREGSARLFDNVYDVLLWVYVHTPDFEMAPDPQPGSTQRSGTTNRFLNLSGARPCQPVSFSWTAKRPARTSGRVEQLPDFVGSFDSERKIRILMT